MRAAVARVTDGCVCLYNIRACVAAGGILFPRGVSVSDRRGGDAHQTGAG